MSRPSHAVKKLLKRDKAIFEARAKEGLPIAAIAERFGVATRTVFRVLRSARAEVESAEPGTGKEDAMKTSLNGRTQAGSVFVPSALDRRDTERRERYRRNLSFYNGEHWPGRAHGRERRLTFNYAKAAVEKVTSYLLADIRSTVPPLDASPEEQERARRAERLLADIAETNSLDQLDFDTEIDTAVLGDGAYKITWDDERGRHPHHHAGRAGPPLLVGGR